MDLSSISVIGSASGTDFVDDLDPTALALVLLEDDSGDPPAREARGVEEVQRCPVAGRGADLGQESLESGAVLVGAGIDGIRELTDEAFALGPRQLP
jgi:hypothetical protein